MTATIDLPAVKYRESYRQVQFASALVKGLTNSPDIHGAAVSSGLPFSDTSDVGINFFGRPAGSGDSGTTAKYYRITPKYFHVMEIPLIRGRLFTGQDTAKSQPVVIINAMMANRFFPGEDPIGQQLVISGPSHERRIVGVVGDVTQTGLKGPINPEVYEPFSQKPSDSFNIIVRGLNSDLLAETIHVQVTTLDKEQPVSNVTTMKESVAISSAGDRFATILLSLFSGLALLLAAVGIYGVVAYSVLQRTQEFSIRMAVGANRIDIIGIVVRHGLALTVAGLLIGFGGALFLTRMLSSLLFQVSPLDVASFSSSIILLGLISIVAFLVPARRAASVDPMKALRSE